MAAELQELVTRRRLEAAAENWTVKGLAGAGALRSTAWDMLTFAAATCSSRAGSPYQGLRDTRIARLPAARGLTAREGDSIGLNWLVSHRGGRTIVWHNGGTGGYRTFLGLDPAAARAVVVLSNTAGYGADDLGFYLLDSTISRAPAPVSYPVMQAFRQGGTTAAIARYRRLKAVESSRWVFDPEELNTAGYWLLEHGHAADAVAVFRLNVEEYPAESNSHDSLAEALLAIGDTVEAIRSYQRAIAIDTLNTGAVSAVKRLRTTAGH
jgi:CubicO group peptidase (beta-lactamase class C family)